MNANSVYWIRCQDHTDMMSQGYIGVSRNAEVRFTQHSKQTQNLNLKAAIKEYGWDNLVKTKILVAERGYCLDIERKLRPANNIGWNCTAGGGNPPDLSGRRFKRNTPIWNKGKKSGPETKKKISDAVRLAMQNPARRELNRLARLGMPSPRKGQKHTDEARAKISASKMGCASKRKGTQLTEEQKAKVSIAIRMFSWECPHCQTQGFGQGAATRWHFDRCKNKG